VRSDTEPFLRSDSAPVRHGQGELTGYEPKVLAQSVDWRLNFIGRRASGLPVSFLVSVAQCGTLEEDPIKSLHAKE
jgi:hypothetical protein